MIERVPPHNKEAEQSIIGAIFLQPESLIVASERLQPQDFYQTAHQQIFEVMLELSDKGSPVDVVTVSEVFAARKALEEIGGLGYLLDLSNAVPTAANVEYYADIVSEKSVLRRLIRTATKIVDDGYMREDEVGELLSDAERSIMEVANKRNASDFRHIEGVLNR